MEYKVVFVANAINDFETSIDWYANINSSLAKQFKIEIETTIKFIAKNPLLFPNTYHLYKAVNTSKFRLK